MVPMAPSRTRIWSSRASVSNRARSGIAFLVSRSSFLVGWRHCLTARTRNEKRETSLLTSVTRTDLSVYGGAGSRFHRVFVEAVAEASHGADQAGIGGVGLDFLAEPQDIDVYCAV